MSKKKRSIKALSIILATAMVFVIGLSGCKPAANTSSTASGTKTLAPYTVNYMLMNPISDVSDQTAVEASLNDYLAKPGHLANTKIHFTFIDASQYQSKLQLMTAANQTFDLAGTGADLATMVSKGVFIPIDNLLKSDAPTIMKRVTPAYWPATTIKGKIYAIPIPFVVAQSTGWVFQKSLVDKYKFDAKSVTDLTMAEPYLAAVKAGEPGITGIFPSTTFTTESAYLDFLTPFIAYDANSNKLEWVYDDAQIQKNCNTMNYFYKKGYVATDYLANKDNGNAMIKTGKYALTQDVGEHDPTSKKSESMFGYPTVEVKKYVSMVGTAKVDTCYAAIGATSKDPARAMMFSNYLFTDKTFANMCGYGKEGLTYDVTADAGTDHPTVVERATSHWTIWICWISPLWDQWNSNWNSTAALDQMQKDVKDARTSPIVGFIPDFTQEPLKSEIAQLTTINSEAGYVLASGSEPDATTYLAQIKDRANKAGLQDVLTRVNQQITDWKAANGK